MLCLSLSISPLFSSLSISYKCPWQTLQAYHWLKYIRLIHIVVSLQALYTIQYMFYLQNWLIQTSQTGCQPYNDTSPFSIPRLLLPICNLSGRRHQGVRAQHRDRPKHPGRRRNLPPEVLHLFRRHRRRRRCHRRLLRLRKVGLIDGVTIGPNCFVVLVSMSLNLFPSLHTMPARSFPYKSSTKRALLANIRLGWNGW